MHLLDPHRVLSDGYDFAVTRLKGLLAYLSILVRESQERILRNPSKLQRHLCQYRLFALLEVNLAQREPSITSMQGCPPLKMALTTVE